MKSIKPGRGPSFMGGIGSIVSAIFGVFWTITASSIGAPVFFSLFGIVFVIMSIGYVIYNFRNATSDNRFSTFDITDDDEEPDPINKYYHNNENRKIDNNDANESEKSNFCPYCGFKVGADHLFCKRCGKKIT